MKEVKLTVRKEGDGSRSLFLLHDQLSEHRAGPRALTENPDAADFYRRVEQVRKDYAAQGVLVTFSDES